MKHFVALIVVSALLTGYSGPARACDVEPAIFCGPFKEMAAGMPDSAKKELLALPKNEHWQLHFGLGMAVRNEFGLWQDNALTRFFRANGIDHPDEMSGPFIDGYVLYLQGKPVYMKRVLEDPANRPPPPPEPPRSKESTSLESS